MPIKLILASTSVYRQQLLSKLNYPFTAINPNIDESPLTDETAIQLVERLARQKALAGSALIAADTSSQHNKHSNIVIGSDQVALINGDIVGKPHTAENAIKQLTQASGQAITFYTGLAVYCADTKVMHSCVEPFTVHFRQLTEAQIRYYVNTEQPLYCAGSFKSEGLGIALFDKLEGDDPNTLIGLPLIKLIDLLALQGIDVLA
ncbi:Maf family protein [Shewanella glacialimarina]|jgi:MAF protein|uniref:Maf family protein n=1 Tax=Shewanella glacialimarina TaxID=2590884 RepID=UPI001CF91D50|nr:Maf family protein [Shewanella glacialimarina]UCX05048.1 septum formation inhibitor Maf [Shewanella glacialimarina]